MTFLEVLDEVGRVGLVHFGQFGSRLGFVVGLGLVPAFVLLSLRILLLPPFSGRIETDHVGLGPLPLVLFQQLLLRPRGFDGGRVKIKV